MSWDDDDRGPGGIRYGVWIPRDPNVKALPDIIKGFDDNGYEIIPVDMIPKNRLVPLDPRNKK
jgi:hypothetical protein